MYAITEHLIDRARSLGACDRLRAGMTDAELAELLFSPQGREFCAEHDFPKSSIFMGESRSRLMDMGVYVDAGAVSIDGRHDVCLIGHTRARIKADGTESLYHVILLGGASAVVDASGYAVVSVDRSCSSRVTVNNDKTAVVHVSQR